MPRIVLDTRACADLLEHLEVIRRAHRQALRFKLLALLAQLGRAVLEFGSYGIDGSRQPFLTRDVMGRGEDVHVMHPFDHIAGEGMQRGNRVDLVTKELDAHRELLIDRNDLDGIAAHAEGAASERDVIALVLHRNKRAQQVVAVDLVALVEEQHPPRVFLRRAQAVDA